MKNKKVKLKWPDQKKRRELDDWLECWVDELKKARTFLDAGMALSRLLRFTKLYCDEFGMDLRGLNTELTNIRDVLTKQANGDRSLIVSRLPGRAAYSEINKAILQAAQKLNNFTVNDIQDALPHVSRASLISNLNSLATKGEKPLVLLVRGQLGRRGKPAVYSLRLQR